jgi:hypothetical protein
VAEVVEKALIQQEITGYLVVQVVVQGVPMRQIQAQEVLVIHQAHLRRKVIAEDRQLG